MRLRKITFTLPEYLAGYLINNDATGLTDIEQKEIDEFLKANNVGSCLSCDGLNDIEAHFAHSNDLNNMGCNVYDYVFVRLPKNKVYARTIDKIVTKLDCKFGAPMGRNNVGTKPQNQKIFDCCLPMSSDSAYDKGGAYWGIGNQLRVQYTRDLSYIRFYRIGDIL